MEVIVPFPVRIELNYWEG